MQLSAERLGARGASRMQPSVEAGLKGTHRSRSFSFMIAACFSWTCLSSASLSICGPVRGRQ